MVPNINWFEETSVSGRYQRRAEERGDCAAREGRAGQVRVPGSAGRVPQAARDEGGAHPEAGGAAEGLGLRQPQEAGHRLGGLNVFVRILFGRRLVRKQPGLSITS